MRIRARSVGTLIAALCAFCALVAVPAAAQSRNSDLIESLNVQLLYVALPLTLFVMVILVYSVVRFRDNDDPKPTAEDAPLEITWTVVTAIILLFVCVSAYTVLANPYVSYNQPTDAGPGDGGGEGAEIPDDAIVVNVVAYQWNWQFSYPEANLTTQNELVVPEDQDVYLVMTSRDVIHSLAIPELGVKQDVFPEEQTTIRTHVNATGEYQAACTEFCGARHSHMRANVTVVEEEEYREWLETHSDEEDVTDSPNRTDTADTGA